MSQSGLLGVGRKGVRVSVQEAVEPIELPVQTLNQVFRFTGPRKVVILAREKNDLRDNAVVLQGAKPLLALFNRHAIVVVRMKNQGGGLNFVGILQRRTVPVKIHLLKNVAAKIGRVTVGAVARAVVGNEIRQTAQSDGGL